MNLDSRLREQVHYFFTKNVASLAGKSWPEVKEFLKKETLDNYLAKIPNAETTQALSMRIQSFYVDVVERHLLECNGIKLSNKEPNKLPKLQEQSKRQVVLIVSHWGPISRLIRHLVHDLGFEAEKNACRFPRTTGIYSIELKYRDSAWHGEIIKANCVSHLANLDAFVLVENNIKIDPKKKKKKKKKELEFLGSSVLASFFPGQTPSGPKRSLGW